MGLQRVGHDWTTFTSQATERKVALSWVFKNDWIKLHALEPMLCHKRSHHNEKPWAPHLKKSSTQQGILSIAPLPSPPKNGYEVWFGRITEKMCERTECGRWGDRDYGWLLIWGMDEGGIHWDGKYWTKKVLNIELSFSFAFVFWSVLENRTDCRILFRLC